MDIAVHVVSAVIALGIFNVWLLRFGKGTKYRGGSAANMKEEFAAYGLPPPAMYAIGGLKCLLAVLLIVGIGVPVLTQPAAITMAVLMLGAVSMHIKVQDEPIKSLPAFTMLVLSAFVAVFAVGPG